MPLTDKQKLAIVGSAAALLAIAAAVLLVRHFTPPARTVKTVPAPDLVPAVHALLDELRQLPPDARALRLTPPPENLEVKPDVPALQVAFDALADADAIEVLHVERIGEDGTIEASIRYEDTNGETRQIALLCRRVRERIVPVTLLR